MKLRRMSKPVLATFVLTALLFPKAQAQEAGEPNGGMCIGEGHVCLSYEQACVPVQFAGVVAAVTNDAQVLRLLGKGYGGDHELGRSRYYTDPKHSAWLEVDMDYDLVVSRIYLTRKIPAYMTAGILKTAASPLFDAHDGFGRDQALRLGAGKAEVKANLGAPPDEESDTWTYDLPAHCVAAGSLTLEFTHDRVSAVRLGAYHELNAGKPKPR